MTDTSRGLWEREAESAAVAEAVEDVTQGGGGLLLVEGPAGIGKTRLLAQARAAGAEAGTQVLAARGTVLEREFAFGVVRQLFEPLLAHADPAGREALWQGPAAQARRVFATTNPAAGPAGDFAVLHGLYWLTSNTSQGHPLVLLLDDLQWCDIPSLRYLAYLLPRIEDQSILVAAALRTGEEATDERLLPQITTDPAARILRPHPLSAHATTQLLERELPGSVDPRFAAACHQATGGNPLLLRELARTLTAEGTTASAGNAALVRGLGSRAVRRLVAVRMARLPEGALALARAAAVLGDHADLTTTAPLADQDATTALEGAVALQRLQILRTEQHDHGGLRLAFIHPLVQAAVHDSIDHADLATIHHRAARLLADAGADPEQVAAHLLHTPPSGNREVVTALRTAAAAAAARGAPEGAYTYLRRALAEPPSNDQHLSVLTEAGQAAVLVDLPAAADHLQQAMDMTIDPVQRADIAATLGTTYMYMSEADRGFTVLSEAQGQLAAAQEGRRRHLQAGALAAAIWLVPGRTDIFAALPALRRLPRHDSLGGRLLDCAIASREMIGLCDPAAVSRARAALADGSLTEQANGDAALMCGWNALWYADDEQVVMDSLNAAIKQAHHHGSLSALAQAHMHRGFLWLWRGQLSEAEQDAREALHLAELAGLTMSQYYTIPLLAQILLEKGRLEQAEQTLSMADIASAPVSHIYMNLDALSQVQNRSGDHQGALKTALQAQQVCQVYDIRNPAVVGWRTEAALALHALDRTGEARQIAADELEPARRWGAPRALGRALRINGLLTGGNAGLTLLQEAVSVLKHSPARLEHAKALTDLGAVLRRTTLTGPDAREPLRRALDLATRCGATPLAETARTELAAAGGRPRHTALTGPGALTPSERRVAELAATGATNRQIAQTLFVTPKTVEVHLSAAYRKLGIATRTQLTTALTTSQ
ncbi:helix-turn-helix transcriptional regulator [Streptomyces sp. NPDC002659]|uniref:helix-turn-helix transcriptional regulator n=1 Tax=Streptomyces sp. NPDC002659 TaxID=3364656 RepID=UPI0036B79EB0